MPADRPSDLFRVAIGQINTTVGAIQKNTDQIMSALKDISQHAPDLIVFPELAITGYPPEDLLHNSEFIRANLKAIKLLAENPKLPPFVVGFVDRSKFGQLYNAAAFIRKGRVETVYHKCELPNYGVFDEKRYFAPGSKGGVIDYSSKIKIGLSICEDMWITNSFLYDKRFTKDLSFIINISASPYHAGKHRDRIRLVQSLARSSKKAVVYANLVGGQDELVFDGGSMIADAKAELLAEAPLFEETFIAADIPCKTNTFPISAHKDKLPIHSARHLNPEDEVYRALVLGTRDYIEKNGFSKVVIGLSGGIDSALVASIACDALGKDRVVGVTMPSRYTSKETLRDAKAMAHNMGIACHTVGIEPAFETFLKTLKPYFKNAPPNITEENLQARIRGTLLMAFSNKWEYLVLTTGNKSEMATGYCTLYGDMAGGFAVIKDVPKTLVFRLARFRNQKSGRPWIPKSIILRPPTAELKHDQKDQDTLPPYSVLDQVLKDYIELDKPASIIASKKIGRSTVDRVIRLVDKSEYKRRQSPPGIKITPKSFGRDRRMPITNQFEAY